MKFKLKLLGSAVSCVLWAGCIPQLQAAELALSDVPLFIKDGVDPNMIVTLDDSGSMSWAYIPDNISSTRHERRFKSSSYNPMYYNPEIIYIAPKNEDGVSYTTTFTHAYEHGFITSKGWRNLSNNYRPTYTYNPAGSPSLAYHSTQDFSNSAKDDGTLAYYYVFDSSRSGCNGSTADNDCHRLVRVGASGNKVAESQHPGGYDVDDNGVINAADEQQNFANWYSFYRTRVLAAASAASLGFQAVGSNVRVAYQNLHECDGFDNRCQDHRNSSSHQYDSRVRPFTGTHRSNFYEWLAYAPANGGTPLRSAMARAGDLIESTDTYSPYAKDPGVTRDPMYECRPTYHIAMTDGIWNGSSSSYGNYDSTNRTTPGGCDGTAAAGCDGYQRSYGPMSYTARNPYQDNSSTTVSDIVFSQWINDAQPNIPNQVPTYIRAPNSNPTVEYWDARNDPAEWQHMVTFMVGFGLSGSLTGDSTRPAFSGGTFDGEYANVVAGTKSWPNVGSNDSDNPYDLWHAAVNGRGEFFSAEDPNSLVNAFTAIIAGISDRQASAASVALDSGVVNGLSFAYHASFSSSGWTGDLKSFELLAPTYEPSSTATWSAGTQLTARSASSRNIQVKNSSGNLATFSWSNLDTSTKSLLNLNASGISDGQGQNRVDYLRGSRTNENLSTGMRPRNSLLGDIIHSSPTYVGSPSRVGMDTLEGITESAGNSYASYKSAQASRTPLVFVGANDGMFHAFNATTGAETFAFIPTAVLPNLRYLTYPGYTHRFFVDGPSATADVYDRSTSSWKTIVVGTLRNGGKSVFALDVTDPANISLLWEFSDVDLGYVYSRPAIVRLHNNTWGVLIANGYNSTNHKAVMYVLDALTGSTTKKFNTGRGSVADPNGLASPSPIDINGDLVVDYVYSGDLKGNVWRFDLLNAGSADALAGNSSTHARNNASPTSWSIAYGGNPLYVAKDASSQTQPITTNIVAAPHETGTGIIVMFGTGKYIESSDAQQDTAHVQSYYGIWDRYILGEATSSGTISSTSRSNLQPQTLSSSVTETFDQGGTPVTQTVRTVSDNSVSWYDYSQSPPIRTKDGWYIDFVENGTDYGEMLVTDSIVLGNNVVFATTIPNTDPCSAGVDRWVWSLDIQTGGRTDTPAFDLNNDNVIDDGDLNSADGINNSVKVEGFGAPSAVGERIYLNLDNSIQTELVGIGGNNLRRSWRVVR